MAKGFLSQSQEVFDDTNDAWRVNVVAGNLSAGDIELGAVEIKNGTDDTRATVTASNALKVDGSAVIQPVKIDQTTPGTTNAVTIVDTAGKDLDMRQENENWNAADHGILMFGRDTDSTPNKYRAFNLSSEGDLHVDLSDINGVEPAVGTGTSNTGTLRVTLATDIALPTGTNTLGSIKGIASTTGGCSPFKLISAASTNGTNIKASAGQVYAIHAINLNAAVRYLKLYNKATTPTVGTDTPVMTLAIPAATTGAGFTFSIPVGLAFATGIGIGLTTAAADADTGAVAANEIIVGVAYA